MLGIAVTSLATDDAEAVVESWRGLGEADIDVGVVVWSPDLRVAAAHQLVVGVAGGHVSPPDQAAIDVWTDTAAAPELWRSRVLPFRDNLVANRRAPRRRVAELVASQPTWAAHAARLIARLERMLGDAALRVDHIGSTSVPGLPAKDLIDIQVTVPDLDIADAAAAHAREAGLVRVDGRWTGPDRTGTQYDEIVLVDADPGRPVNVNLRPVGDPVWRETLLFRDWLRADVEHRDRYLAFKRQLAATTRDVDEYSEGKLAWIGDVLDEASRWARDTGRAVPSA